MGQILQGLGGSSFLVGFCMSSVLIPIFLIIFTLLLEYRTGLFIPKKRPYCSQKVFKYGLVGVDDKYKQDVEVFYNGKPVTNWGNVVIEFGNDGREEIAVVDFEGAEPIRFDFPEETLILSEPEVTTVPTNLRCEAKLVNGHTIEVSPLLLNSKEQFVLSVLTENPQIANIDVRIAGVSKIEESRREINILNEVRRSCSLSLLLGLIFFVLVVILLMVLFRFVFF